MDPAQAIELHAKRDHKLMDDLIARGDSPVQQFYRGTTVFVTGGSGFIGKQLIEKLFRSCAIEKMYLLSRSKKNKTIEERLEFMLKDVVFDRVHEIHPKFVEKIVPVEGDVSDIKLGLSIEDWTKLTEEVDIIFHEAATIRFDEPLHIATLTNVRGTREVLKLAKQCVKLKKFVHVSTAFSHATCDRIDCDVDERFYPCPVPPNTMIALAEEVDVNRLDSIEKDLIKGWPNTYTFTKAIAEELVRTSAGDLPVCIIRPSIVPAYFEPNPGWLDKHTIYGPSGVYLGGGLGVLRVFYADMVSDFAIAPVDYVNNATIAAAWDSTERHKNGETDISVYNIATKFRLGSFEKLLQSHKKSLSSPKSLWYAKTVFTKSKIVYFFLSWFYHYIPAYVMDFMLKILGKELPEGMNSLVDLFKKVDKLASVYSFFTVNQWNFKGDNFEAMFGRMNEADKIIFKCDLSNLDKIEYVLVWGIGLRKYIVQDGLVGTSESGKHQIKLRIAHYLVITIYISVLCFILSFIFIILKYILSCFI